MEAFFKLATVFVNEPLRAALMAFLFMGFALSDRWVARRVPDVKPWVQLVPATAWLLFAMNESYARAAGANIRIDLFITWPLMVGLTFVGLYAWTTNLRRAWRARDGSQT